MATRRTVQWLVLIAAVLAATFLRFYQIGAQSLWDGEIFTLLFAQYDWKTLVPSVGAFSAHPPLWFIVSKLAIAGGWNETLLRAPAAFAGILAVPALYVLGKRLFNARVGLLGAVLIALSPIHVIFSQNARNYAFFVLLVILLIYSAVRAVTLSPPTQPSPPVPLPKGEGSKRWWWVLFAFCGLAGLYTHYLFILPLMGTILAIVLKLVYEAIQRTGNWKNVRGWWGIALVSGRAFLIALIAIAALYLPWTPTVGSAFLGRQLTREEGHAEDDSAALTLQDAPRLLKDFSGSATWGLVLFTALAVVGVAWAWQSKKRAALFWFAVSLALPLLAMLLLAPRRLPAKYLIYVLPAYLLLVACAIEGIAQFFRTRLVKSDTGALAFSGVLLAVLLVATVPNMPYWKGTKTIFTSEGWTVVDDWKPWRDVAASVTSRAQPGDMILFPEEARALTARSVVPYFDNAFLGKIYSVPPQGRVWWVSEQQDVTNTPHAPLVSSNTFESVVVQEWQPTPKFREITVPNASLEDGFKQWTKSNIPAQWDHDEHFFVDGKASARVTLTKAQNTPMRSATFDVTPGKLYRVTAYVKNPTVGFYTVSPQLYVDFYNASNATPKRTRLPTLAPSDKPGWMLMVTDGIVPDDATTARIEFLFRDYALALNPTSWIDNVRVWVEE